MTNYQFPNEAICDLHEKGYTCDFQLVGNDLFWIQEKIFVRAGDFSILHCHRFPQTNPNEPDTVIFGIAAHGHNVKGILLNHYTSYTDKTPPVIKKKLLEMYACTDDY